MVLKIKLKNLTIMGEYFSTCVFFRLPFSRFAGLYCLLFGYVFCIACSLSTASSKPKVWLKSYTPVDGFAIKPFPLAAQHFEKFRTDTISKAGNVYTILSDVGHVYFMCEAEYPIQWNVPVPNQMMYVKQYMYDLYSERESEFDGYLKEPQNTRFFMQLEIWFSQSTFIGGNFTCESINEEGEPLSTGIYVFGEGEEILQASGQVISAVMSENKTQFFLPCRAALPSLKISLFKKNNNSSITTEEWIRVALSESVRFDPMYGFTMDSTQLTEVITTYKCQLEHDPDIWVLVYVDMKDQTKNSQKTLELKQFFNSSKAFVSKEKGFVECCTGDGESPPSAGIFMCKGGNHCQIAKRILENEYFEGRLSLLKHGDGHDSKKCYEADVILPSAFLLCQSSEEEVFAKFIKVYDNTQKLNDTKIEDWHSTIRWSADQMHLHNLQTEPALDEKITVRFASPLINSKFKGDPDSSVAYVLHSTENEQIFSAEPEGKLSRNATYLTSHLGDIYEGETLYVICFSLRYYYGNGGWLRINWRNRSKSVIEGEWNNKENEVAYMGTYKEQNNALIGYIPKTDKNMKSVDCFAPQWNTTSWDKRTIPLTIQSAIPPKLEEPTVTFVNLTKIAGNQFGAREISCALIDGKPMPTLTWEKDGQVIDWKQSFPGLKIITYGNETSVTIHFLNVTKQINGKYKCIAKNKGGEAVNEFTVLVTEHADRTYSPSSIVMLSVLCMFFLSLLVIIAITKRIRERKE